ncbi:MAG: hypothetical protein ACRD3Z_05240 [Nitrososphaerales archaeon]
MDFIFSLWDLGAWLGVSAFMILVASEVISPDYGRINTLVDFGKMRRVAIALSVAFLSISALNAVSMI